MNESNAPRRLRRTRTDRVLAGVCSGAGEFFGIDANMIRLALAILCLLGGSGVLIYLIGWLLIPEEGEAASIAENMINSAKQRNG